MCSECDCTWCSRNERRAFKTSDVLGAVLVACDDKSITCEQAVAEIKELIKPVEDLLP